jgi:hypothetical protein
MIMAFCGSKTMSYLPPVACESLVSINFPSTELSWGGSYRICLPIMNSTSRMLPFDALYRWRVNRQSAGLQLDGIICQNPGHVLRRHGSRIPAPSCQIGYGCELSWRRSRWVLEAADHSLALVTITLVVPGMQQASLENMWRVFGVP